MSSPLELLTRYEPALICIPERRRMISCPIYPCYVPFFHCNYKRSWRKRQKCGDDTEHQCTCICLRIMLKLHITLWKMAGHSCPSSKCRQMCDRCPHSATWKKYIWESQYSQTFGSKQSVEASIIQSWKRQIKQQGVKDIKDKNMADIWEHTSWSDFHTCPLALILCVKSIFVAIAASVPELGACVCLFVIVPADAVVPARALVQNQATAGVQGDSLCRRRCHMNERTRFHLI